jgi:hypothetical protein
MEGRRTCKTSSRASRHLRKLLNLIPDIPLFGFFAKPHDLSLPLESGQSEGFSLLLCFIKNQYQPVPVGKSLAETSMADSIRRNKNFSSIEEFDNGNPYRRINEG